MPARSKLNAGSVHRDAEVHEPDAFATKIKKAKFSLPEAVSLLHGLDIILEDS